MASVASMTAIMPPYQRLRTEQTPPVRDHVLAGHEGRLDAEADGLADVLGAAEPAERRLLGVPGDALRHQHRAGRDAAHADVLAAPGEGQRLHQVDLRRLG